MWYVLLRLRYMRHKSGESNFAVIWLTFRDGNMDIALRENLKSQYFLC